MSWLGALTAFAAAIAVVGIGLVVYVLKRRARSLGEPDDTGAIGCGLILFVIGMTIAGAVVL